MIVAQNVSRAPSWITRAELAAHAGDPPEVRVGLLAGREVELRARVHRRELRRC